MVASIPQIIAAINPDKYYDHGGSKKKLNEFKKLIKEKGILRAAEQAEEAEDQKHVLTYESYAETLEPVYYFILDLMSDRGLKPQKLLDNFSPSPSSPQYSDMFQKLASARQYAMNHMGAVNAVLKSVMNIVYDLRDGATIMRPYKELRSDDPKLQRAARLSLKQRWMDKVDMMKGNSGMKALATQAGMSTLIHAFLAADTVDDAVKLDLNEIVKRIVIPRVQEFNHWVEESERELKKRYEIERNYLKSQVNTLKLYSRWAKPYLITAQGLESKPTTSAGLTKAFNRTILELTLFGKQTMKTKEEVIGGALPQHMRNEKLLDKLRKYHSCVLVDFTFRAVPQQTAYIGRVDVTFRGYTLNDDEVAKLEQLLEQSDLNAALSLIQGATEDSLAEIEKDIKKFLEESDEDLQPIPKQKKKSEDVNPFLAITGYYERKEKKPAVKRGALETPEEAKPEVIIKNEIWEESEFMRPLAEEKTQELTFDLFNIYKKAHGMPAYI